MASNPKIQIRSLGEEIAEILIGMTDEEKTIALAMMQGMAVGKQIAEQKQKEPA